jgi:hypothetical protein
MSAPLEQALRELAAEVEYPPTPPLAAAVAGRLEAGRRPARRRSPARRAALPAAALVLLLAGTVIAAVPGARHAVLDLFGLRGATVERVGALPDDVVARPGLGLGRPVTPAQVRHRLAFDPLLPTGLGEPDGVFVSPIPPGGQLSLTYPPGPETAPRSRYTGVGLLINEVRGLILPAFYGKMVPRGVRIERLEIEGRPAVWVRGLHEFQYVDRNHTFRIDRTRLAGRALLVQYRWLTVRIEGELSLAEATRIARSLR